MNKTGSLVLRLNKIRNRYGIEFLKEKSGLLESLSRQIIKGKVALKVYYETLLFLIAYPDNKTISEKASSSLKTLELYLQNNEGVAGSLYNSGITGTQVCAAFSFEMVKWLRHTHKNDITLDSIEADDGQIRSAISVIMPKVESEILQDANAEWKEWLNKTGNKRGGLLDKLLHVFDQTDLRPEVRDTLWDNLGIDVTIMLTKHTSLPASLTYPYYHRSLIKSKITAKEVKEKPIKVKLNLKEREQLVNCARMILIRHLREMDPITFTATSLVSYYKLSRGLTVAIFGMTIERRQPVDSYMSYVAFKNGLPFAYGGSWVLFDSARTALNVFPAYRGGESRHSFEEVMNLHKQVYRLKRFTLDPYQLGKDNDDGIQSGAFWVYHHIGFRPIKEKQKKLAEEEFLKIKSIHNYRSTPKVLKQLADSRMELILKPHPVQFDAGDISIAYANILRKQYNNNRKAGEEIAFNKLVKFLGVKNYYETNINFVLKNWAIILISNEPELYKNKELKNTLKKAFSLKAYGVEEDYIAELNGSLQLRKFVENIIAVNSL
jgi:hypothetical protein